MNNMELFKAFGDIDDNLVFDAGQDGADNSGTAPAFVPVQPKNNKPRRGGAKTKAIAIGAAAIVLAAAIVCMVLYFTGVIGGKQVPIYTGMEISATNTSASASSANAVSYIYSGDYTGRSDGLDKNNPYGSGSATIESETASTLTVVSAGDYIYYADAGDDIYVTINFDNPDKYDIVSFSLSDGTNTYDFSGLLNNFESGSTYEQIIVKLNVGTTGGIIEYSISKIKYLDDNSVNSDVIIGGETVVRCGVRVSDITYAQITDEATTLTSISFNVNIVDKYALIAYSNGYAKAVLYDGESIIDTVDLEVGENSVEFTDLSPDTIYQYAVVAYYDDLSGSGAALNFLYKNAVYTPAVVLFDEDSIVIDQTGITFGYSWYTGYSGSITSLTLTGGGETVTLDSTATSVTGLLSDNEYALTATYIGTNGETSITLNFTTVAKATPSVDITVTEATVSTLTFNVDFNDTDGVGEITAVELYNGETLVKSETNLNQIEYTYSGLDAYTDYTLKVTYSYDLNDGVGTHTAETELTENTLPSLTINSISLVNTSAVVEGGTINVKAEIDNPENVKFNSVEINGETYSVLSISTETVLYVNITNNGQFAGGDTTLTVTSINCTVDNETYSVAVNENNEISVFINGELTVENFYIARYNAESGEYEETNYGLANEQLYYVISLGNATEYDIDSVTIGGTVYSPDKTLSDYQTVYIPVYTENAATTLNAIVYSNSYVDSKTKTFNISAGYFRALSVSKVVEITTAEQLLDVDDNAYYKLMNDIDVSEYKSTWVNMGNNLVGVFDGNGYTISGLSAAEDYYNTSLSMGLFNYAEGIIMNLTVEAFYIVTLNITVSGSYGVSVGGLAISSNELYVDNVNVDVTASITTYGDVNGITACGICGSVGGTLNVLTNSTVNDNISITVKDGTTNGIEVGGLYGSINVQPYGTAEIADTDVTIKANVVFENSTLDTYGSINIGGLTGTSWLYNDCILSNVSINRSLTLMGATSSYANGVYAGNTTMYGGTFKVS